MILRARDRVVRFSRRPLVMGILNLGEGSFSGDALADTDEALRRARQMAREGADMVDVGAVSASTGAPDIPEEEEMARLLPLVRRYAEEMGAEAPLLSINTWRPGVARAVLSAGGDLLNDMSALPDEKNARLCAETGAALLIMHNEGEPKKWHAYHAYEDVMGVLERFFENRIALAESCGVAREALVLDPGIGFTKLRDDNLRILRELERLQRFERPLLLPVSRKRVIGEVLDVPAVERDAGTVACVVSVMRRGGHIVRVHNVRAAVAAISAVEAVMHPRLQCAPL